MLFKKGDDELLEKQQDQFKKELKVLKFISNIPKYKEYRNNLLEYLDKLNKFKNKHYICNKSLLYLVEVNTDSEKLIDNAKALMAALMRAKPNASKGVYLKKVSITTTMGPGVKLDKNEFTA